MPDPRFDVAVIGAGNAALCAALAARQQGASVVVVERAPVDRRAGNAVFTGGLVRFAYNGIDEVRALVPALTSDEASALDVGQYTAEDFFLDIAAVTEYQADADLSDVLSRSSYPTLLWLRDRGVPFAPSLGLHAMRTDGKYRFRGNAPIEVVGGGQGLADRLFEAARAQGVDVWYETRALGLQTRDGRISGVRLRRNGVESTVSCGSVVLACGGFEANAEMRAKYLGPDWDVVKVRGSEFNTGDGIRMALEIGARPFGNWTGCHATPTDVNAPPFGDRTGKHWERHSYNFGIMVNRLGDRFVDEASDYETHTYAKLGREILKQPGRVAFQMFDARTAPLLRSEYRAAYATRVEAKTLEELAGRLEIDSLRLRQTVDTFNGAVQDGTFNPATKDGKRTAGLSPAKSNWSLPLDMPPYVAYPVTCGITFTYGGLRISTSGEVLDEDDRAIPGLYAAGELVGGVFYLNYPTGCGITYGAVFGKIAGVSAGQLAVTAGA